MRAYICFMHDDGWAFDFLAEDCQAVTKWRSIDLRNRFSG
jgi:hypothetical protein